MAKNIGKNVNVADTANLSVVSVGSVTAETLVNAKLPGDNELIEVCVTNKGNTSLWVRKRPASADNEKTGRRVPPGESTLIIQNGELYTGEVSGIFDSGSNRDVVVEVL